MYPRWLPSRVQVCRSKDLNLFTLSRLSAESRNTDYMNDVTRVTNKLITSRYNRRGTFWMKYESSRAWSNLTSVSTVHGLSFWTLSLPQRRSAHWRVASRRQWGKWHEWSRWWRWRLNYGDISNYTVRQKCTALLLQ